MQHLRTHHRSLELEALRLRYLLRVAAQDFRLNWLDLGFGRRVNGVILKRESLQSDLPVRRRNTISPISFAEWLSSVSSIAGRIIPRTRGGWAAAASLSTMAAAAGAPPAVAYWRLATVESRYAALQNNARAVEIYDATHRLIGIAETSATGGQDHLVLPAKAIPDGFFRVFEALEDKPRLNPLRDWYGIDAYSSAVGVACYIYKHALRPDQKCRGGSTIEQSTARGWNSRFGGMDDGSTESHKLEHVRDATSLSVIMSRNPSRGRILAADSISYGTAPGGYEMWGLRSLTLTAWGVEPEHASAGQLAVAAALAKFRIPWSCDPSRRFNTDEQRIRARIKERAIYGLQQAYPANDPAALAAIAEVKSMVLPTSPAPIDPALTVGMDVRTACLAASNPLTRIARLMPGASAALRTELSTIEARYGKVEAIELSEDLASHRAFQTTIDSTLASIDNNRGALGERLIGNGPLADTLAIVAAPNGQITHYATSSQRDMLHSGVQTGSTGKLVIALAASVSGFGPEHELCQLQDTLTNVRDAGGGFAGYVSCEQAGSRISISASFGPSKNLPILHLGRGLNPALIEQAMRDTGFSLPEATERSFGLVTGLSINTPARVIAMQTAIANGISGRPAIGFEPTIIARVLINGRWLVPQGKAMDLSRYFATPQARAFMAAAATSALTDPHGTLRSVTSYPQILETGKTGTVPGPRPLLATRIKWASGALPGQASWVTLIAARSGYVGDRSFSSIELSKTVRGIAARSSFVGQGRLPNKDEVEVKAFP